VAVQKHPGRGAPVHTQVAVLTVPAGQTHAPAWQVAGIATSLQTPPLLTAQYCWGSPQPPLVPPLPDEPLAPPAPALPPRPPVPAPPPVPPVSHCQPSLVQTHIRVLRPGQRHRVGTPVPGEQTHWPPTHDAGVRRSPHVSTVAPLPGRQKTVPSLGVHAPPSPAAPPPPTPPLPVVPPARDPPTLDPPAPGPPSGCSGLLPQLPAPASVVTAAQSSNRRSIPCVFAQFMAPPK
jgi:hypothetical protein